MQAHGINSRKVALWGKHYLSAREKGILGTTIENL
jgi:hypothetical protein